MKIGDITFNQGPVLALGPMAGVTDLPFRMLCKEQGCDLLYTEMVSAKAISYHNKNTIPLMEIADGEHPVALQLFGSEPELMGEIAAQVAEGPADIIDVNMGCPVPKIVGNGEGSALMKNPELVYQILSSMTRQCKKPVTVKIRAGFDEDHLNAVEVAQAAESAGVAAIAVHGRTRMQYYSGKADWQIIRQVKEAVHIPVIGNGDVIDGPSAKRLLDETGCEGIMIARAARGNPWIFHEVKHFLATGEELPKPQLPELLAMIVRHAKLMAECKGEYTAVREMRKHVAWYTAGRPHSASIRNQVNQIDNLEDLIGLTRNIQ